MSALPQPRDVASYLEQLFTRYRSGDAQSAQDLVALWRHYGLTPAMIENLVGLSINMGVQRLMIDAAEIWLVENPAEPLLRSKLIGLYLNIKSYEPTLPHYAYFISHEARNDPQIYDLYCDALFMAKRLDDEIALARQAEAMFPANDAFYRYEGLALTGQGRYREAQEAFTRCLEHCAHYLPNMHVSRAVLTLMCSDLRDGYEDYEHRFKQHNALDISVLIANYGIPRWQGEAVAGKKLLVLQEQGIGDVIMWGTLLPQLLAEGAIITLAVLPKLKPLFARSFPQITLHDFTLDTVAMQAAQHDYLVPMADIMRYVLPRYEPAAHAPVYRADPDMTAQLRARYQALAKARGARAIVGISWFTTNDRTGLYRNIPLDEWQPLFAMKEILFVSLQYGDHAAEIEAANARFGDALYLDGQIDAFADTDHLAAQIAAMDQVVTIQNSTSHIAGALGIPTRILLSRASSWRFGDRRTDTRWYRSVTIERQEKIFDWPPVFERIRHHLTTIL